MNSMKRQNIYIYYFGRRRPTPPGLKVSNMLPGKSRGQLLLIIALERMKQLGQSRNNAQLWMCLVVKVESDVVKNTA